MATTPVFLPGESQGRRSLVGCHLSGCTESDMTEVTQQQQQISLQITDTKGTFHAKMGATKDRNSKDLTETDDTKKKWQEYTEEFIQKRS